MKKLEDLKKGDIIKIQYGYSLHDFKVISNYDDKLYGVVSVFPFTFFLGIKIIIEYEEYHLKYYELLNK